MKRIIRQNQLNPHFLQSIERFDAHRAHYFHASKEWAIAQDVHDIVNIVYAISNAKRYYCQLEKARSRLIRSHHDNRLTLTHEAKTMLALAKDMPHLHGFEQIYPQCLCHPYVNLFMECATQNLYEQGQLLFDDRYVSQHQLYRRFQGFIDALREGTHCAQIVYAQRAFMHEGLQNRKQASKLFKVYAQHAFVAIELGYEHCAHAPVELEQMEQNLQAFIAVLTAQVTDAKAFLYKSCHWGVQGWRHYLIVWLEHQEGFRSARNAGAQFIELWNQTILKQDTGRHGLGAVLYSYVPAPYETAATGWGKKRLSALPAQDDTLAYLESLSSYIQTQLPWADGIPLIRWGKLS